MGFSLWVGRGTAFFFQVVFGVESVLFTVHVPLGQGPIDFRCNLCFFKFSFEGGGGAVFTAESSQFFDMFPKGFPISPHFYPICFGKCCPSFTCIDGPRELTLCFKIEPSLLGSLHSFIQIGSLPNKRKFELWRRVI